MCLFLGTFPSIYFILSQGVTFWFIRFYDYPIETYLFSNERKKGSRVDTDERGCGKELGGIQGGEIVIRIYYVRKEKNYFQ